MFDFIKTIKNGESTVTPDYKFRVIDDNQIHYFGVHTVKNDLVKLFCERGYLVEESKDTFTAYGENDLPKDIDLETVLG